MAIEGPALALPRFEGPLDLLLELVRKNEIDITDIPIAEITRQYLEYLEQAERLDIALSAEFTYTAATLIHIKSRCLLPRDPEIAARDQDPREDLVRQLLDYQSVRQAAEFLRQKLQVTEATWSRPAAGEFLAEASGTPPAVDTINLLQILRLAKQALETARAYEGLVPEDPVTVEQMMQWLNDRLRQNTTLFDSLLTECSHSRHRTALFLAMLELARGAQIEMDQEECFGPIRLKLKTG
jgi:segregation and condensation protein A